MSIFKEIVTKAVVGKGKKISTNEYYLEITDSPSTILGCWIINHTFKGTKTNDTVLVEGKFDTNIWYSKNDNKETEVAKQTINYQEEIPIKILDDYEGQDEIIVRIIKQPTCSNAEIVDGKIKYTIEKTIAAELVGDTKIRVGIDEETTTEKDDTVEEKIDEEVNEDFLK